MSALDHKHRYSRGDLESALMDAEGDMLLLNLALEDVDRSINEVRPADKDNQLRPVLHEDQMTALTHAHGRVVVSLRELSKVFYGKKDDEQ